MCWPPQKKILKRLIKNFKYRIHNKKSHAMNVLFTPSPPPLVQWYCCSFLQSLQMVHYTETSAVVVVFWYLQGMFIEIRAFKIQQQ